MMPSFHILVGWTVAQKYSNGHMSVCLTIGIYVSITKQTQYNWGRI